MKERANKTGIARVAPVTKEKDNNRLRSGFSQRKEK